MLWGFFWSLQADGLDSGESSAEPPHLANISVSVRALTGIYRLLMTQATPAVRECTKAVVLQLITCDEVFLIYLFFFFLSARYQRTQTIHTHTKETTFRLKKHLLWASTRPDASGPLPGQWKSTDLFETQSMGQPFSDQTVFCFFSETTFAGGLALQELHL